MKKLAINYNSTELNKFMNSEPNSKEILEKVSQELYNIISTYFEIKYIKSDIRELNYEERGEKYNDLINEDLESIFEEFDPTYELDVDYIFEDCENEDLDYTSLIDYMYSYLIASSIIQDFFDKNKEEKLNELSTIKGFNEYGTFYNNEYDTFDGKPPEYLDEYISVDNINELNELNDKINDKVQVDFRIDIKTKDMREGRDAGFIYINGEFIEGDDEISHSKLINEYCLENNIKPIFDEKEEKENVEEVIKRPDAKVINERLNGKPFAAGSLIDNIAFIEALEYCDLNTLINDLQSEYDIEKIYYYRSNSEPNCTRIANKN